MLGAGHGSWWSTVSVLQTELTRTSSSSKNLFDNFTISPLSRVPHELLLGSLGGQLSDLAGSRLHVWAPLDHLIRLA
jgi:hypothetical protein